MGWTSQKFEFANICILWIFANNSRKFVTFCACTCAPLHMSSRHCHVKSDAYGMPSTRNGFSLAGKKKKKKRPHTAHAFPKIEFKWQAAFALLKDTPKSRLYMMHVVVWDKGLELLENMFARQQIKGSICDNVYILLPDFLVFDSTAGLAQYVIQLRLRHAWGIHAGPFKLAPSCCGFAGIVIALILE